MANYDKIPAELKALPNWVSWKLVPDPDRGKPRKVPYDPRSGEPARSNDPSTWCGFDIASTAEGYDGIGFMFSNSPYFGVDIDGVTDEIDRYMQGEPGLLADFVDTLQSYTEISTSGGGIHIICRGTLPPHGRRRGNIEMYEDGRFFVMTGRSASQYPDISECTETIKTLHEQYIGGGTTPAEAPIEAPASCPDSIDDILAAIQRSASADKFFRLWHGDCTGYPSQSEADMALCNHLAFWCRCDAAKMDAMFRQSGLMREKWDRQQAGSTYGIFTIQKAIAGCSKVYTPSERLQNAAGAYVTIGGTSTPKMYSFDDMGNAERFCDYFGGFIRYSYVDKRWLYYDRRKWVSDRGGEIEKAAERSIQMMDAEAQLYDTGDPENPSDEFKAFQKWRKRSRSSAAKKAMLEELHHHLPILPEQTDTDTTLLNAVNGYINLESGRLFEHEADRYMTKIVPVEYDPEAECPTWLTFLDTVFAGDEDLIRYIQKAVGYSLSGDTSEQCVFFLYGSGSNGKSTFLSTVRQICGDYAANVQPETIMVKPSSGGGANSDIARLKSARFVTSVEPNEGMRLNEGLIKQLSGEDPVTARKLYGDEFEFMPEFKLWMGTNHKPIIRGTDTGIWRRVHMIPFTVCIPDDKKDKQLPGKLRRELPGILAWAVRGYQLYKQDKGLKMPAAVYQAVAEYRHEMDSISQFLEECTEPGGDVPANMLYAAYKDWARSGEQYVHTSTKFGVEVSKQYQKMKDVRGIKYIGLHLTNPPSRM